MGLGIPAAVCSCRSACAGILDSFWTPFGPVQLLLLDAISQYLNLRLEPTAAHLHAPASPHHHVSFSDVDHSMQSVYNESGSKV